MNTSITEDQLFERQRRLVGPGQQQIRSLRVLVIGAGGLGCPALQYLAATGVGVIGIVDCDVVSASNLHRQILYSVDDLGTPKAQVAARKLERLAPFTKVRAFREFFDEVRSEMIEDFDVVLDCTDNFQTKFLIHDECQRRKKVLIQAAVYQTEGQLHVFDFRTGVGPCWRCLWERAPEDGCTGTCAEVGVLGPLLGTLGSFQAMEALKVALGQTVLANGEGLFLDLQSLSLTRRRWQKRADCSGCAGSTPKREALQIPLPEGLSGYEVLDVRETEEHRSCSKLLGLCDVTHVPLRELSEFSPDPEKKYLLVCASGVRSLKGARLLRTKGAKAYSLFGGL